MGAFSQEVIERVKAKFEEVFSPLKEKDGHFTLPVYGVSKGLSRLVFPVEPVYARKDTFIRSVGSFPITAKGRLVVDEEFLKDQENLEKLSNYVSKFRRDDEREFGEPMLADELPEYFQKEEDLYVLEGIISITTGYPVPQAVIGLDPDNTIGFDNVSVEARHEED